MPTPASRRTVGPQQTSEKDGGGMELEVVGWGDSPLLLGPALPGLQVLATPPPTAPPTEPQDIGTRCDCPGKGL